VQTQPLPSIESSMKILTPLRLGSVAVVALLLTRLAAGQTPIPETIPDHVCLPSVSEEDAAWRRTIQEFAAAADEFDVVDVPALAVFKAEEKVIVMDLIKRKKDLDAHYEVAYKLTSTLSSVSYPCSNPELYSSALGLACKELAAAATLVRIADNRYCRDVSPSNHVAFVNEGSPCAAAAKKYWSTTGNARSKYEERTNAALASYKRAMMPACSLWQRATFQELDRPTLRARQQCVAVYPMPSEVTQCTQKFLNTR
jgi:hypothetical protein